MDSSTNRFPTFRRLAVSHLYFQTGALLGVLPAVIRWKLPIELFFELSFPLHTQSRILATLPTLPRTVMVLGMNVPALIDFAFRQMRIPSPAEQWLETSLGFLKAMVVQPIQRMCQASPKSCACGGP
jgi:hypothetical protein